jgi:hypothetical protein
MYGVIIHKRCKTIINMGMVVLKWTTSNIALTWMTGHEMAYSKGRDLAYSKGHEMAYLKGRDLA